MILLVLLVKIKMIKFYFSYISISGSSLNLVTSLSLSNSSSFSNLNLVGLQGKDIGFFFNNGTDAYFYLLLIFICFDIKLESLSDNNQTPLSVNLNDTIYVSIHVKDSNYKVEIVPNEINSKENSIQFFINNENIINNYYYTLENSNIFTFYSGLKTGEYSFNYKFYDTSDGLNGECFIKLIISCSNNFPNCNKCEYISDENSESCKTCDTDNYYYPLTKDNGITECYKNESRPDGYYLDSNIYMKCDENCLTCNSFSNSINPICLTCDTSQQYYPLNVNSLTKCYKMKLNLMDMY